MKYGFLTLFIGSLIFNTSDSIAQNRTGCCDIKQAKDRKAKGWGAPYDSENLQTQKKFVVDTFNTGWMKETKSKAKLSDFDSVFLTLIYLHNNSLGIQTPDTPIICKKENLNKKSSKKRLKKIMSPALRQALLDFVLFNTANTDESKEMNLILEEIIFSKDYE
jgi:hypothetical protein